MPITDNNTLLYVYLHCKIRHSVTMRVYILNPLMLHGILKDMEFTSVNHVFCFVFKAINQKFPNMRIVIFYKVYS